MGLLSRPKIHVIKVTGGQEEVRKMKEEIAGWLLNMI